jgi:hypothetical protein
MKCYAVAVMMQSRGKERLFKEFECNDLGELKEYVGCKIDCDYETRSIKITQLVLIQSFIG